MFNNILLFIIFSSLFGSIVFACIALYELRKLRKLKKR